MKWEMGKVIKGILKRILVYILIFLIAFLIYALSTLLTNFFGGLGKEAYQKQDYVNAYKNLKIANSLNPRNIDIRYYYVQTMLELKPTLEIQKNLFNISQVNLPDSADLIADKQISLWKNQIMLDAGQNYIEKAPFNDSILRWDAAKFPLKVFIKNNSTTAPSYYRTQIEKAFGQWQASTNGFINFNLVNDEKDANIDVSINPSTNMKKCSGEDCKYTIAYTIPKINGNILKKMNIYFYDSNNLGQPFSEREIYNTALHEIGHSLGIMGHSSDKNNLMYMETNPSAIFDNFRSDFQFISQADLNTLNLLYKIIPDITNTPLSEFDTSHQFFAPIVMGNDQQITSQKIIEAQNYINGAPELPDGYIDLAIAFSEEKRYNYAIDTLNKAIPLCSNDEERFIVYYNLAVTYMQIRDWNDTLEYANLAKQCNADSDIDGVIAMANYNLGNKQLAKEGFKEVIEKNPSDIVNSYNLAVLYIKELNFVQAGKILNQLIKANPDAKNDPRIKMYSLVIFLFK